MFDSSIFGEILKLLPRDLVRDSVARHEADKWSKGFSSWDHLSAMLAAQYCGVGSLRELEVVFNSPRGQHYHLATDQVRRSTLADANGRRAPGVFSDIVSGLMAAGGRRSRADRWEAGALLSVLGSTAITLSGRGSAWAEAHRTRNGNQGLKLHIEQDHGTGAPRYVALTNTTVNDVTQALDVPIEAGRTYVFDKGYCDYNWWRAIVEAGASFVTRLKRNAALRLIRIPHPAGKSHPFWIVASDLDASARKIADTYKARWAIELLFKWLKQNLKIKRFLGQTRNAVMIQILVAMIAYILLRDYHRALNRNAPKRLKDTLVFVRANLFDRPETRNRKHRLINQRYERQPGLWTMTQLDA